MENSKSQTALPVKPGIIHRPRTHKYGITEKKKAELDALQLQIVDAQYKVDQFTAIEASLTDRLNNFQALLAKAEGNRTQALNNRNLLDQLVQSALDLNSNSDIAVKEVRLADLKTIELGKKVKSLIDKLIYSVEMINRLSTLVTRKKALNPLISDELASSIVKAGTDANNAVALTLVALKSVFMAQASNMESEAALALGYLQSITLCRMLTGNVDEEMVVQSETEESMKNAEASASVQANPLRKLLYDAYTTAKASYNEMHDAYTVAVQQLNEIKGEVNKAQVNLKSLQSGLAAGNAAALAS